MPRRVKVQGDLYHGRVPDGAVYVGRGARGLKQSPFRNPFSVAKVGSAREAVRLYRAYLDDHPELVEQARAELAGRDLACWCKLPAESEPDVCHAVVLLELANG